MKVEKDFWVSDTEILRLNKQSTLNTFMHGHESMDYKNKITISWDAPEKKITLSESELSEALEDIDSTIDWNKFKRELKQKLFHGGAK